jgi:hypothetical protein
LTCLSKQQVDRYASAKDLAEDLEQFLARKPVRTRPKSLFRQVTKALGKVGLIRELHSTNSLCQILFAVEREK